MQQKSRINCLTLKNKFEDLKIRRKKIMEKKKYEFKAFDSNGKEIELCSGKFIFKLQGNPRIFSSWEELQQSL